MRAIGHNLIIKLDETETKYTSEMIKDNNAGSPTFGQMVPLLVKAATFELASRYATVVECGQKVEDIKKGDKIYLRAQATIGSEFTVDDVNYNVVDQAEVLVAF